jgi:lipopolysaccharide/colanic/teichoic acid biosynthesis glycosyltransferase
MGQIASIGATREGRSMDRGVTRFQGGSLQGGSGQALVSTAPPPPIDLPSHVWLAPALKRAFDLAVSLLALILLAPFLIAIAIAIKLDSPGPVLYRQRRVGKGGGYFKMLKFRTMEDGAHSRRDELRHLNECEDGLFKLTEDPRVTRVGHFLRATSLDELPQLLHVVTGVMSLVGPRPLVPEEDLLIMGEYRKRLELRPGITGPWQVAGASQVPIREMVKLDHDYVLSQSLRGDLRLLFGTLPHVVGRRGR